MGGDCLQEQGSVSGRRILDEMFKEGHKGCERVGSGNIREEQAWENRGGCWHVNVC